MLHLHGVLINAFKLRPSWSQGSGNAELTSLTDKVNPRRKGLHCLSALGLAVGPPLGDLGDAQGS